MLQRYLILWLALVSLVALYWSHFADSAFDPFVASKPLLPALITLTMFAIGWLLPRDEVAQVARRWPAVLGGTALQYLAMPALAYGVARWGGFRGDLFIGLVMVGCVPGAMASNVLTYNAGGNTSYSVSLTTAATLLSPLAVPLVLGLALQTEAGVDIGFLLSASRQLLLTVVLPVLAGHLLARLFPKIQACVCPIGAAIANLAILWIIAVVVGLNRELLVGWDSDLPIVGLVTGLLAINLGGYLAGYGGGAAMKLPEPMRRALTLEVGMQNAGLGAFLATQLFADRAGIAIAPAMYSFGCMLSGSVLAGIWSRRAMSATHGEP